MSTTVQIRNVTRRLLDRLKKETGLSSYDEVIRRLVTTRTGMPESLFGVCRGSLPFSRELEAEHAL